MAATHTTNLGLNKPDRQDYVSVVTDINDNMDTIDAALAAALPSVTSSDNGKFLRVVEGVWAAATIANANGVST